MSIQTSVNLWKGEKHKKWLNTLFDEYVIFLSKSDKKDYTQEKEICSLIYFFRYLEDENYNKISLDSVYNYVDYMNNKFSNGTVYTRNKNLKYFLNYLYNKKKISFDGNMVFPKLKQPTSNSIMSYYTNKEITQVLNSISIKNDIGKRNFAIVSLFAYLGMREEDVRILKFQSIDWDNNLIKFYQSKTNSLTILPMPMMVKLSLLDYLKNARSSIKNDFIFIKNDGNLYSPEYFSGVINKIINSSGIDIKGRKCGCHSFRHSLATNLLNKHVDINIVSKVLGHSNTETTINEYIAYDKQHLLMLPLEVPEWK